MVDRVHPEAVRHRDNGMDKVRDRCRELVTRTAMTHRARPGHPIRARQSPPHPLAISASAKAADSATRNVSAIVMPSVMIVQKKAI